MGYYIYFRDCDFTIKKENKQKALEALKELFAKRPTLSWVSQSDIKDKEAIEDALSECRWETECDESGDIVWIRFSGEKSGDDGVIFDSIAPFVEKNSYIEMRGEENEIWRWIFDGEHCKEIYPTTTWECAIKDLVAALSVGGKDTRCLLVSVIERNISTALYPDLSSAQAGMKKELEQSARNHLAGYELGKDYLIDTLTAWSNCNPHCNCDWKIVQF